jgi:thioredoxin-like negative regulator of GroEL
VNRLSVAPIEELEEVNDQSYPGFLVGNSVVVFGIASCQPCSEFDPILKEAALKFRGRVKFGKARMHVPGACREIKRKFDFDTFPTTHFYKNGELVHTLDVKVEMEDLSRLVEDHLLSK